MNFKATFIRVNLIKFFRYGLVGGTSFVCEYAVFWLLFSALSVPVLLANLASFIVSLVVNFSLNRAYVFKDGSRRARHQFALFTALALCNLVITSVLLVALQHYGVSPQIGKLGVMVCVVLWNFALLHTVIFKAKA